MALLQGLQVRDFSILNPEDERKSLLGMEIAHIDPVKHELCVTLLRDKLIRILSFYWKRAATNCQTHCDSLVLDGVKHTLTFLINEENILLHCSFHRVTCHHEAQIERD